MGSVDASTLALIIVGAIAALATPIAWAGYRWGKQTRAEDQAKEFGRLEGWADAAGNRRGGGDATAYSIGGLTEAVNTMKQSLERIQRSQDNDARERHDIRESFKDMRRDIASLKKSFATLSQKMGRKGPI